MSKYTRFLWSGPHQLVSVSDGEAGFGAGAKLFMARGRLVDKGDMEPATVLAIDDYPENSDWLPLSGKERKSKGKRDE